MGPAESEPEPGHHLVEDEEGARVVAYLPEAFEVTGLRSDEPRCGHDRLKYDARQIVSLGDLPRGLDVVEGHGVSVLRGLGVEASALRPPEGAAHVRVEAVVSAVPAPLHLQHLHPPRVGPGEACPVEVGQGAAACVPHHLRRGHVPDYAFGELDLLLVGEPVVGSKVQLLSHGFHHGLRAVAQYQGPVAHPVVRVDVAVDVVDPHPLRVVDVERVRRQRADGVAHPRRQNLCRSLAQRLRSLGPVHVTHKNPPRHIERVGSRL